MSRNIITLKDFSFMISKLLKSDRYALIVGSGEMGEGKSCITSQLCKEVANYTKTPFSYNDNITFSRKELKEWIDGNKDGKNRKQENTSILADELINMFFKRNWYDSEQIDGIQLLNKCRDRHLLIAGNVPNFWDLDSGIYPLVTYWLHIHERGRAWVFEKDRNPFVTDKWHRKYNEKQFNKDRNPYKCVGFVGEIRFNDWPAKEKEEYYTVRNTKRIISEKKERPESFKIMRLQRNALLKLFVKHAPDINKKVIAESLGISLRRVHKLLE